jgi:hypothetical protein
MIMLSVTFLGGRTELVSITADKPLQDLRRYFRAECVEILSYKP